MTAPEPPGVCELALTAAALLATAALDIAAATAAARQSPVDFGAGPAIEAERVTAPPAPSPFAGLAAALEAPWCGGAGFTRPSYGDRFARQACEAPVEETKS